MNETSDATNNSSDLVCNQCQSPVYAIAETYIQKGEDGEFNMIELDDLEAQVLCDNDECGFEVSPPSAALDEYVGQLAGFLDRCNRSYRAMREITEIMSGTEWSSDTLSEIATVVRMAGFEIKDSAPEE